MSLPKTDHLVHYHRYRLFLLLFGVMQIGAAIYELITLFAGISSLSFPFVFAVFLLALIGLIELSVAFSVYIVTTPETISYAQLGLCMHTYWSNLRTIETLSSMGQSITFIRLEKPAVIDWVWTKAGREAKIQVWSLNGYAYGPFSPLGRALRGYAPQLFQEHNLAESISTQE